MNKPLVPGMLYQVTACGVCLLTLLIAEETTRGQTQARSYRAPRTTDGVPDLNGIWQVLNTANWNLEPHEAKAGPISSLGAVFSIPAGAGVVIGGAIPYQPWASEEKKQRGAHWTTLDPEVKCYLPGIPRATYMPFPFQIVQNRSEILFAYEFASASRIVRINSKEEAPVESWMGWSRGNWEGETLVITATDFTPDTWLDRAGNFHSDALKVIERYTRVAPDVLSYEATIEDPKVFTRPWKIAMPLYRRLEPDAQLLEFKCVEFAEELMYGTLRRKNDR
jgi:hypothetical protein